MTIGVLGIKHIPATAGADRVVEQLLGHFSRRHEYYIYTLTGPGIPVPECRDNIHYIAVPSAGGKHLKAFIYFFLCTAHCVVKGRYDRYHIHNSDFGVFAWIVRLFSRSSIIGTFHGNPYERAKWGGFARWFLRFSERMFISACHQLTSVSQFKMVSGRTVHYIPNGIDAVRSTEPFDVNAEISPQLTAGKYILFACGRLDRTKGLHVLLEAYHRSGNTMPLLAVGDFNHDQEYSRSIMEMAARIPSVILYRQLLPKPKLYSVIEGCSFFVFPSEVEAMSMMLLEVISCKKPVVCSSIPENTALVGETYPYLFAPDDVDRLAELLRKKFQSDDVTALTEQLYRQCSVQYSWPTIAARYEALYQ